MSGSGGNPQSLLDPFSYPLAIKINSDSTITPDSTPDAPQAPEEKKASPLDKAIGGVKNELKGGKGKEKEESSPELQEAVRKMEERKAETVAEMQAQGQDRKALSGRKRDQVEFAPGEGSRGL
jgi:hypothetical protein